MNFSGLSRESLLGRLARAPLRLVPPEATMRIVQGPARGLRWIAGAGTHGCWLGSYERDTQQCLLSILEPGMTFYDLGANVGFYSVLAASVVGSQGRVVAFEPLPRNLGFLQRHVAINGLSQVTVVPSAVAARRGTARFTVHERGEMGQLAATGGMEVAVTTLDDFVFSGAERPPDVIKVDVEGAECAVLEGARRTLREVRPRLFIAQHHPEIRERCLEILRESDYRIEGFPLGCAPAESWELFALPASHPAAP